MRKHDAERQDDKNRNLTLPLDDGKSALEEFWSFQNLCGRLERRVAQD